MQNELTTEQKARVFALYLGQMALYNDSGDKLKVELRAVDTHTNSCRFFQANTLSSYRWCSFDEFQLLLRPLSAITDDDAIEVAKLWPVWKGCTESLRPFVIDRVKWVMFDRNKPQGEMPWQVREFLIQRGYAVPLFIAPGHPCNGMTAIEMGLAIAVTDENTTT